MVTFESDEERFAVFLGDSRAAFSMAIEDGAWRNQEKLARYYRLLHHIASAPLN